MDGVDQLDWLGHDLISVDLGPRKISYASPSAAARLRASRADLELIELRGPALEALLERLFVDPETRRRMASLLEAQPPHAEKFEYRVLDDGVERWREASVRVTETASGPQLDVVSRDITDLVEVRRAAEVAEGMRRIGEAVHSAPDLDAALRSVSELVREQLRVDRSVVAVFGARGEALVGTVGLTGAAPPPPIFDWSSLATFVEQHGRVCQFEDLGSVGLDLDHLVRAGFARLAMGFVGAATDFFGVVSIARVDAAPFSVAEMTFLGEVADRLAGPLAQKALEDERRRSAARAAEAEERLRTALDAADIGIWEFDARTEFVRWDEYCFALWEFDPAGGPQRAAALERIHPDDRATLAKAYARAADPSGPGGFRVEYRYEAPRGLKHLAARGRFHFDPEGRPVRFIGTLQDVSDARRLEGKLVAQQKLESLGVLAGGIAHDFNNLLVGVLGNAGLAKLELPPSSPVLDYVDGIESAALRASELTRQLLAYAGKARFVISSIDLRALVEEMGHLLTAVIGKGVVLRYQFGAGVPLVRGDATQLRQVVMNLITNASDAIGERSGIVTLATSLITADRRYLEETLLDDSLEPGDYVCLQVSDTGIGMDAATQARIFEPFFTTKFTGRGLGLAAVQGILHAHRGSLKVYSEVGRGSTFKLLLPAADGPPDLENEVPPVLGSTSGATILVVDDEPVVRNMTKRVLTNAGYRVLVAGDGEEGVEVFRTHRAEIEAVILDVTMPRMGGEEAFRHLRSIEPRVRVILVSGYSEQEATSQFAGKGLSAFLEKPYRPTVLLEKLRAVLAEAD